MRKIRTEDGIGHVLCHDMTQILPGEFKGPRFSKGHVVQEEDIPVLLSMGKEHLYVLEMTPGTVHENDGAQALCALCCNAHMTPSPVKEGKIELIADMDGLFCVDEERLTAINSIGEIIIATRHGNTAVKKGDKLCGMRVIPLTIQEERLEQARSAAGETPILSLRPFVKKTAAILVTGNEVKKGRITDRFSPVVAEKLSAFGIETILCRAVGDDREDIAREIREAHAMGAQLILCSGGMSVDPDDNTPGGILRSGAQVVTYGAPVLPGAMLLLAYLPDGTPVVGLPGCVMYAGATVFDLILPKLAADVVMTPEDFGKMGNGGLCLGCDSCIYPHCSFGKGI